MRLPLPRAGEGRGEGRALNEQARMLRRNQTEAEKRLWYRLKNRGLGGWKFRRQHAIGPYFADFACIEAALVVEIDCGQHQERTAQDRARTAFLEENGYRVVRFWNNDVLNNTDGVLQSVLEALRPSPLPSPRKRGEGEVGMGADEPWGRAK